MGAACLTQIISEFLARPAEHSHPPRTAIWESAQFHGVVGDDRIVLLSGITLMANLALNSDIVDAALAQLLQKKASLTPEAPFRGGTRLRDQGRGRPETPDHLRSGFVCVAQDQRRESLGTAFTMGRFGGWFRIGHNLEE